MKKTFLPVLLLMVFNLHSQYYYKDIAGTGELNKEMKLYLNEGITSITSSGYDQNNIKSVEFYEQRRITKEPPVYKTINRVGYSKSSSQTISFNGQTLPVTIIDSAGYTVSITKYEYDNNNRIISISNTTQDTSLQINEKEEHLWFYNEASIPEKMLRVLNSSDTTEIKFTTDENKNVIEEQTFIKGKAGEKIYYYYNADNRITDIVRYNTRLQKLLPDYMFEYAEKGQLLQKITTIADKNITYLIWRYQYDDKGLKTREATFGKNKKLMGRIDYKYSFGK